ncbi:hypothetical protein BY996DRAFT_4576583 [Phakopsora pachyrhizi]|uniref:Zn(2)-C6 fungal-type domain-containing protein n=1 Tax=Phakopsora pachyrhizi TaxID=170000 RepID=A0AAV0AQI4_PHAPC|nr:hypothetical protein BY996DRAFT_4576583 [Phakopsora pachyrhizi]CAH7671395.1 hypothetical protein PPACK8108_LOCUS6169 [Phakopsora pachyrhizi]
MSTSQSFNTPKFPRPPQRPPACRACKRRKSKCDFQSPCSTCELHKTQDSCLYDTMAVPRERKTTTIISERLELKLRILLNYCFYRLSSRISDIKKLRDKLAEAEQDLKEMRALIGDTEPSPPDYAEGQVAPINSEGLADIMTRLVIDKAIKPAPLTNDAQVSPELLSPNSSAETKSLDHNLREAILELLQSQLSCRKEYLASNFTLSAPNQATHNPAPSPIFPNTILPQQATIDSVEELAARFPPTRAEALALLENYVGFVNLVHNVVDGPQTRHEIDFFYDLISSQCYPVPVNPHMPLSIVSGPGWLGSILAIFVLACKGLSNPSYSNEQCERWLDGSLQALRICLKGESILDMSALRCVCLVVWIAIAGKTYSPVGVDGHDVHLPKLDIDRDPIPLAIEGLAFRSLLMKQLRKLATLALKPGGISNSDAIAFEKKLKELDDRLPKCGYPRFHPIVGGLTLAALMANGSDLKERDYLIEELDNFTAVIKKFGSLSQVTNYGILAIEMVLDQVKRKKLGEQIILGALILDSKQQEKNYDPNHKSAAVPENANMGLPQFFNPTYAKSPQSSDVTYFSQFIPPPIHIPTLASPHSTQDDLKPFQLSGNSGIQFSEPQISSGHWSVDRATSSGPQITSSNLISPLASTHSIGNRRSLDPEFYQQTGSFGNFLANFGSGVVGCEGLMVGWMDPNAENHSSNHLTDGSTSSESIPPMLNTFHGTWKQEW